MFVAFPILIALGGAAVVALIAIRVRRVAPRVAVVVAPADRMAAAIAVRAMRARMLASLAALAIGLVAFLGDPFGFQPARWLGVGLALGPGLAAILALGVIAVAPFPRWAVPTEAVRSAELSPRGTGSFGPRWGFVLPTASAALLILVLVSTGVTASLDDAGLSRAFAVPHSGGLAVASPYPGWFYGVPLISMTIVLASLVLLTLHRIAAAPRNSAPGLRDVDSAIRRQLTGFVMFLASCSLLIYFGAVVLVAGMTTQNAAHWIALNESMPVTNAGPALPEVFTEGFIQPQYATGIAEIVVGVLLLVGAVVLGMLAVRTMNRPVLEIESATDTSRVSA